MAWRRVYPGRTDQAAAARRFVAFLLADTGRGDDAEFIAAELVSNALLYTRSGALSGRQHGCFGVEVMLGQFACIAVHDLGGGGVPCLMPEQDAYGVILEHGRGLLGVSKLAVSLGFEGSPVEGHKVWAELEVRKDLPAEMP
jgi:hypothetical protein